jgi:CMP-N,N'-diacetyllegionaminic acid synthase
MKILGIIPARGGSQGIPGKNIKLMNGLPLIVYTIQQATKATLIDRVIVSTDDEKIAECAKRYGADVPFLRPTHLASSMSSTLELILHAVEYLEGQGEMYDKVCLLQPTSPFRPEGVIDEAIRFYACQENRSLVTIRKIPTHYNPYWAFNLEEGRLSRSIPGPLITRRQDLPVAYNRDGAIYILDINFMKKEGKLLSEDLCGFEIESPVLINIDGPEDWEIAEKYINVISS